MKNWYEKCECEHEKEYHSNFGMKCVMYKCECEKFE